MWKCRLCVFTAFLQGDLATAERLAFECVYVLDGGDGTLRGEPRIITRFGASALGARWYRVVCTHVGIALDDGAELYGDILVETHKYTYAAVSLESAHAALVLRRRTAQARPLRRYAASVSPQNCRCLRRPWPCRAVVWRSLLRPMEISSAPRGCFTPYCSKFCLIRKYRKPSTLQRSSRRCTSSAVTSD